MLAGAQHGADLAAPPLRPRDEGLFGKKKEEKPSRVTPPALPASPSPGDVAVQGRSATTRGQQRDGVARGCARPGAGCPPGIRGAGPGASPCWGGGHPCWISLLARHRFRRGCLGKGRCLPAGLRARLDPERTRKAECCCCFRLRSTTAALPCPSPAVAEARIRGALPHGLCIPSPACRTRSPLTAPPHQPLSHPLRLQSQRPGSRSETRAEPPCHGLARSSKAQLATSAFVGCKTCSLLPSLTPSAHSWEQHGAAACLGQGSCTGLPLWDR